MGTIWGPYGDHRRKFFGMFNGERRFDITNHLLRISWECFRSEFWTKSLLGGSPWVPCCAWPSNLGDTIITKSSPIQSSTAFQTSKKCLLAVPMVMPPCLWFNMAVQHHHPRPTVADGSQPPNKKHWLQSTISVFFDTSSGSTFRTSNGTSSKIAGVTDFNGPTFQPPLQHAWLIPGLANGLAHGLRLGFRLLRSMSRWSPCFPARHGVPSAHWMVYFMENPMKTY